MKVIKVKHFIPGYKAITIGPLVFVKKGAKFDDVDYNHEAIHWEQYKELLILGFWICYLFEFIVLLLRYQNWSKAYRNISFERESYQNEKDLDYIRHRKHYAWTKYRV